MRVNNMFILKQKNIWSTRPAHQRIEPQFVGETHHILVLFHHKEINYV